MTNRILHLAIPVKDLEESKQFYHSLLECTLGRVYEDRISLDFFGMQLVCRLSPDNADPIPKPYPRHFGVTFIERKEFDQFIMLIKSKNLSFFKKPFIRFKGMPEEHNTCFLRDPSNNIIEIKYYTNPEMKY